MFSQNYCDCEKTRKSKCLRGKRELDYEQETKKNENWIISVNICIALKKKNNSKFVVCLVRVKNCPIKNKMMKRIT